MALKNLMHTHYTKKCTSYQCRAYPCLSSGRYSCFLDMELWDCMLQMNKVSCRIPCLIKVYINIQWALLQWREKVQMNRYSLTGLKLAYMYACCFTLISMQITKKKKNICRVPEGQNSQCGKCLLRQNNRVLKCQVVPLRRQLKE